MDKATEKIEFSEILQWYYKNLSRLVLQFEIG